METSARDDKDEAADAYSRNAQHGSNRNGVDVESDRTYDDFGAEMPIDPSRADDRVCDEGEEIRERARERGSTLESDSKPCKP